MYRLYVGIVLVPLIVCLLSFCISSTETRSPFVFRNGPEPQSYDPGICTGVPGGRIARAIFEGLTVLDPESLQVKPGIARSWDVSADGLHYVFHLRKSSWSDGTPCTAEDFRYSWLRVLQPETGAEYINLLYYVKNAQEYAKGLCPASDVGIRAPDDLTLEVDLKHPVPYFLSLAAFQTYLPVPKWVVEKRGRQWVRPEYIVCNGAYFLKGWRLNDRFVLDKNPYYWDAENVRLDRVLALSVESSNTGLNLYMTGQISLITDVPNEAIQVLRNRRDFHISPALSCYYYRFNVTRPPLDDSRVRLALSLSIDRQAIVDRVTCGGEIPARSFVPPGIPGYEVKSCFEENLERAKRLLADAGYPDGEGFPRLSLIYNTSATHRAVAEAVQEMWLKNLGVRIELANVEWKMLLSRMSKLDYEICRSGWIGDYLDPSTFMEIMRSDDGNNRTGWKNTAYDSLLDEAAVELDAARRDELFRRAERLLVAEEAPIAPVLFGVTQLMYRQDLHGIHPNVLNLISFKDVRIGERRR